MLADAASPLRNASYASRFAVGRASSPARTLSASATPSASATLVAMSAWTSKTLVSEASNCWPHRVRSACPGRASTSSGLTRTRLAVPAAFSHRTVPVSR